MSEQVSESMATFLSGIKSALSKPRNKEEADLNAILSDESLSSLQLNDRRLNSIAALTYNIQSCERIFNILEKTISPSDNPHQVIYKSLLIIHSILLYGSEIAIDKCISLVPFMTSLPEYNSALVKKNSFGVSYSTGGTDYGANVRNAAKALLPILMNDNNIRKARVEARERNDNTLVPLGNETSPVVNNNMQSNITFGQGMGSSIGQKFGMDQVPGMYEGRPERYFDNNNDPRRHAISTGNHQTTRDKLAPSLLDLAFDDVANDASKLPDAQFLPALAREKELKRQLELQQQQLSQLQAMAALQQQQQQQQQQQSNNLLNLSNPLMPLVANTGPMSGMFTSYSAGGSNPTPMIATMSASSTVPQPTNYNSYVPVQALQQPISMSGPMGQMNMPIQMPTNIGMMPSTGYQPAQPTMTQQSNYTMHGYAQQSMQPLVMQQQGYAQQSMQPLVMQQQVYAQHSMQPQAIQQQVMYQSDPFSTLGNTGMRPSLSASGGAIEQGDDMPSYLPPPPPQHR